MTTLSTIRSLASAAPPRLSIASLTASQIQGLTAAQINGLTLADLNVLTVSYLTNNQVQGLTAATLGKLANSQVASFSANQFGALSAKQMSGFTASQVAAFSDEQMGLLSAPQVSGLSAAALRGLTAAQIGKLTPSAVGGLATLSSLSATQIAALGTQQIASLSGKQMGSLSAAQVAAMSETQVATLTAAQLNGLSAAAVKGFGAAQIGAISASTVGGLSSLSGLTAIELAALNASQVASLSAKQMSGLSSAQVAGLSQAQVASLTATQVNGLSAAAIKGFSVGQLNALSTTTIGGLSSPALGGFSAAQVAAMLAERATAFSTQQIASFNASQTATTTMVGTKDGLQFNLSWDPYASRAQVGFRNAVVAAATNMARVVNTHATINVQVGYGEIGGKAMPQTAAAESGSTGAMFTYGVVSQALQQKGQNSALQATAAASLAGADPTHGGQFFVSSAEQKALGLKSGSASGLDGYVSLSGKLPFAFNQTAVPGKYDAVGALEHEFSEVMGRTGSVGIAYGARVYTPLDLYRYQNTNGTTTRSLAASSSAYLSIDGGQTNLGNFNPTSGAGDVGDLNASALGDPFGYSVAGARQALTGNDVATMAAIGWDVSPAGVALAATIARYQSV